MKRRLVGFALVSASALFLCHTAIGQTADELIAKNIEAKGGMAKIKAITSLRMAGRLETQGVSIQLVSDQKPDNVVRQSATIEGMTQVQVYDGFEGWQINPFQGRRDPELMGEDDTRDLLEGSDFYGPLVDYQRKGSKVEYVGHETVDGDDALVLKITLKNGDIYKYFLDPDTFLEIRTERLMFVRGSVHDSFNNLGSYKKVNGVYFPFSIESGSLRSPGNAAKITVSKMEANLAIPDSEFKMPAEAPKPAAAQPPGARDASTQDADKPKP